MSHFVIPQNAFASCEEMRSTVFDRKDAVVCPKPRRPPLLVHGVNDTIRPLRWQLSHPVELCDSQAGTDVLDIILTKGGGYGPDQVSGLLASSPPYFCGSPPSRAANPLVHDARFGKQKVHTVSPLPIPVGLPSSPSAASPRKGCARATFGLKPAAVRVEGFNCLERDSQNHSISAVA